MTLIESMVAMTISSVLIIGSISMYTQARSNYRTTESVARMQENLRFSIDILDEDIRLAGYWGRASSNGKFSGIEDVLVTCRGVDVRDWALRTDINGRLEGIAALQSGNLLADEGCSGTAARDNSDVLIVRRAATATNSEAVNGAVQLQSTFTGMSFFDMINDPGNSNREDSQFHNFEFSAYYISNQSRYDEDLPSLRRLTLEGTQIEDRELIPGIENLQVQFGIDTNPGDGIERVDRYVNGDEVNNQTIISVRLWMLVRAEQDEAGQGYTDTRGPYIPPDTTEAAISPQGADADDYPPTSRRMALSRTIELRNKQ